VKKPLNLRGRSARAGGFRLGGWPPTRSCLLLLDYYLAGGCE
jgi:hypothetical protein